MIMSQSYSEACLELVIPYKTCSFFCFQRTLYTSYYISGNLSMQQLIQEIGIIKTATIAIVVTHAIIEQLIHN